MEKIYKDGTKYIGEIKDEKPHGEGTYTNIHALTYKGQWENGKRHGTGTFTGHDYEYTGKWKDGKKHGEGSLTFSSGEKYVGNFENDMRHGEGTSTLQNGDIYIGDFANDLRHGKGTFIRTNSGKKDGFWKHGIYVGEKARNILKLSDAVSPDGTVTHRNRRAKWETSDY